MSEVIEPEFAENSENPSPGLRGIWTELVPKSFPEFAEFGISTTASNGELMSMGKIKNRICATILALALACLALVGCGQTGTCGDGSRAFVAKPGGGRGSTSSRSKTTKSKTVHKSTHGSSDDDECEDDD